MLGCNLARLVSMTEKLESSLAMLASNLAMLENNLVKMESNLAKLEHNHLDRMKDLKQKYLEMLVDNLRMVK